MKWSHGLYWGGIGGEWHWGYALSFRRHMSRHKVRVMPDIIAVIVHVPVEASSFCGTRKMLEFIDMCNRMPGSILWKWWASSPRIRPKIKA